METRERHSKHFAIVAHNVNETNGRLVEEAAMLGFDAFVLSPEDAVRQLRPGDLALGRLDVLPTVDSPEPGVEGLRRLQEKGVTVFNRAGPLLAAHDKLVTALRLWEHGLPHPRTAHVDAASDIALAFPVVVKPRFGSWGRDVTLCRSRLALEECLRDARSKPWFRRQGALVQELVEPQGYDLRIVVAAGEIVGGVKRVAASGEWRTNVALGGQRAVVDLPANACLTALGAASALGTDLAGVDLLPDGNGGWVVLELNGAVDFTADYSLAKECIFERVLQAFARSIPGEAESPGAVVGGLSFEPLPGAAEA
jgi:RimK family alpha-L-glutamate ligase